MNPQQKLNKKKALVQLGFDSCCYWCGNFLPLEQLTLEHLFPKSKGGTNSQENLRLACKPCNNKKGNSLYPPNWQGK